MFKAVESCDLVKVKTLSLQRADLLQIKDQSGRRLLHLTARCTDVALARFLIEQKADVNALDSNGWTPLHAASAASNLSLVKLLIANHAQVNMTDASGLTPLFEGNAEIAKVLLESGADPYVEDKAGQTILHKNPQKALINLLLNRGFDINVKDDKGRTPLHNAVREATRYCSSTKNPNSVSSVVGLKDVEALLAAGADVNAKDNDGVTPLMLGSNDEVLVKLLLSKGADINAKDAHSYTVLHRVVQRDFTPLRPRIVNGDPTGPPLCGLDIYPVNKLDFLLSHGANPNLKDSNGLTVLGALARIEDGRLLVEAAKVLLRHKADLNATDKEGNTILHLAVVTGNSELVEFLLQEQVVKPNPKNARGETPLHLASNLKIAAMLLKYKANLYLQDNQGETPIYKAVSAERVDLVKLLLDAGSDTILGNINGESLLHIAARLGNVPILELLLKAGMKVNRGGSTFRTPLHEAARSSSPKALDAIKVLLANGAGVNVRDKTNSTPLHEVVSKELSESMLDEMKFLLAHGADPNLKNADGQRALEVARDRRENLARFCCVESGKVQNQKFMAEARRLEEVIAVLEKIPYTTGMERRIFGQVRWPDGSPVDATVVVADEDEPATKIWIETRNGRFEFHFAEGHRFRLLAFYDSEKDDVPGRFYATVPTQTVKGDMGLMVITLDKFARKK